jgi:hypothetical protein
MLIDKMAILRAFRLCVFLAALSFLAGLVFSWYVSSGFIESTKYASILLSSVIPFIPLWPSPSRMSLIALSWCTRIIIFIMSLVFLLLAVMLSNLLDGDPWRAQNAAIPLAFFAVVTFCVGLSSLRALGREARMVR